MKIYLTKQYRYSPDGCTTIVAGPGECELPDRFAKKADAAGLVKKAKKSPANKARRAAPRNKAAS